jgi:hypothetical protein
MRKTKFDLDDDDDGLLSRLPPAARTAMADTLERIAERALIELDPCDARRLARIAAWEDEELYRVSTRH